MSIKGVNRIDFGTVSNPNTGDMAEIILHPIKNTNVIASIAVVAISSMAMIGCIFGAYKAGANSYYVAETDALSKINVL